MRKQFTSADFTPPKCCRLRPLPIGWDFRALHLVVQGGSALFMSAWKIFTAVAQTPPVSFVSSHQKRLADARPSGQGSYSWRIFRFVAFFGLILAYKNEKTHDLRRIFNGQSLVFLGALEGTRIPGPLIKRAHRAEHSDFRSFEFTSFLCRTSWFFTA